MNTKSEERKPSRSTRVVLWGGGNGGLVFGTVEPIGVLFDIEPQPNGGYRLNGPIGRWERRVHASIDEAKAAAERALDRIAKLFS